VSENRAELERAAWRPFFESLTKEHAGDTVTIEVLGADFGDQLEAEALPFAYIEFDKDDDLIVGVGGRDGRYPAVLNHIVSHPTSILVDSEAPNVAKAIEVVGDDGTQTVITLRARAALP
jgi:hypothetical protein